MAGQISRLRHEHVRAEEAEWRTDSPAHTGDYTTAQTRAQCGVVKDLGDDGDHTPGTHPSHDTHGHMGTHGTPGHTSSHRNDKEEAGTVMWRGGVA